MNVESGVSGIATLLDSDSDNGKGVDMDRLKPTSKVIPNHMRRFESSICPPDEIRQLRPCSDYTNPPTVWDGVGMERVEVACKVA